MTQYLVFQHLKRQQQELLVVLAFDEDHEKLFPDLPLIGFKKNKNLKSNLVRTLLPDINETGVNHVVKRDLMFNYENCSHMKTDEQYNGSTVADFCSWANNFNLMHCNFWKLSNQTRRQTRFHEHYLQSDHNGIRD